MKCEDCQFWNKEFGQCNDEKNFVTPDGKPCCRHHADAIHEQDYWHDRIVKSLEWLVADAKWRFDQTKDNLDEGSEGGYSDELSEAIALLAELKGE